MKLKSTLQAFVILAMMLLALLLPAYAVSAKDAKDTTKARLAMLSQALEAKRIEHHIPGMAIAIVKDDQVIMAQGFGQMDLAKNQPVTTETLFAIGSTTKAFTATLVGMLKDEQQMDWDDPISQYLPDYQFNVDGKVLPLTLRDLLAHRTGFIRNDMLWASGQTSRDRILQVATQAKPWEPFRDSFQYNNIMFLAVGQALAKQTGTSWDQLLHDRILQPLGMKSSTSVHEQAISSKHIAIGYEWNDSTETHDQLPRRNLNNVAPAGSVYSNVNDMAQWVRFQLNKGQINGQRLLSEAVLQTTHQPQNRVNRDLHYGLGWFLRQWNNQPVVEHGGSIDGYAAQVALLPEANIGFVLLTNVTATPLQQESMGMVWEHLVGEQNPVEPAQQAAVDLSEYVGEYQANFASFKDAIFTFLIKDNGKPAVDVPGQTTYELRNPDQDGKWYFAMTDTVAVSFDRTEDGRIAAMRMHQNRLDFELPRKGVEIIPEIDAAALTPYLGQYQSTLFKGTISAIIQNHRLTVDIPNEMAFELHLPDAEGHRQFRIKSDMSAVFRSNEQQQVTAIEFYRDRTRLLDTATRIDGDSEPLPTVEAVMQLRKTKQRLKALQKHSGFALKGTVSMVNTGITGQITTLFDDQHSYKQHMDFGEFGEVVMVSNQAAAVTYGIKPYTQLHGKYLQQARLDHPAAQIDWQNHYQSVEVIGQKTLRERPVYVLRLKNPGLPATTAFVDSETGDVLKVKMKTLFPSHGAIPITMEFDDFRSRHGLRMPHTITIKNHMMGKTVIEYNRFENKQRFDEDTFATQKP